MNLLNLSICRNKKGPLITWMRLGRTRLNSASMRDPVVEGVRPRRVGHRHGAVVHEPVAVEHPEHGVAAHGQEGGPHAGDVLWINASVSDQHLSHPNYLKKGQIL